MRLSFPDKPLFTSRFRHTVLCSEDNYHWMMVINAKYHLIFRTRYWFVLTYQILNHLFIFSYTVLWDTFVIFIQLNNMYVMILMFFTFPSTSFCQSILLLWLLFCLLKCAPRHRRHFWSVQNGTSYLSITLQMSGYTAQSAFECYSLFCPSSLWLFHALTSLQLSVLCNSRMDPHHLSSIPANCPDCNWNFAAIFFCVWEHM